MLIGNLTRDPELRYTPQGTAVCTIGLATNRTWVTDNGDKKEETEFHRIVAWNKLAELCSQLLFKGRRVYVEGRLQTRQWTGSDGNQRQATEIVIEDMLVLDSKRQGEEAITEAESGNAVIPDVSAPVAEEIPVIQPAVPEAAPTVKSKGKTKTEPAKDKAEEVADDIPF
jgi:single-strand DNA-binding protein